VATGTLNEDDPADRGRTVAPVDGWSVAQAAAATGVDPQRPRDGRAITTQWLHSVRPGVTQGRRIIPMAG
jgi:hypothetical protein